MTGLSFSSASLLMTVGAVVVVLLPAWKRAWRRKLIFETTSNDELPTVGKPVSVNKEGTLVLCGGSITALLSARVCRDYFSRIVIVEPDAWALSNAASTIPGLLETKEVQAADGQVYKSPQHSRSRVWQYVGIHIYRPFLLETLRGLFSNFDQWAKSFGVVIKPVDENLNTDGYYIRAPVSEYKKRGQKFPEMPYCSRRTLEALLRGITKEHCPEVEYILGTVTELNAASDGSTIKSVGIRLFGDASSTITIDSNFVIDCSGNTQAGLKLLSRMLPAAAATVLSTIRDDYQPNMRYSTIEYPAPPNFKDAIANLGVYYPGDASTGPKPFERGETHWLMSWAVSPGIDNHGIFGGLRENGDVIITTGGWDCDSPPVNLQQLREFARESNADRPVPEYWYRFLDLLEPVEEQGTCFVGAVPLCTRIRYEDVAEILPRNFIAYGDATMRVNPRAGEGVTKCAIGAATLDGVLRRSAGGYKDPNFAKTFFKLLSSRTVGVWDGSRLSDYGRESTRPMKGETLAKGRFMRWYMKAYMRVADRDGAVSSAYWHAVEFLGPAIDILSPSIAIKVIWEGLFPSKPTIIQPPAAK